METARVRFARASRRPSTTTNRAARPSRQITFGGPRPTSIDDAADTVLRAGAERGSTVTRQLGNGAFGAPLAAASHLRSTVSTGLRSRRRRDQGPRCRRRPTVRSVLDVIGHVVEQPPHRGGRLERDVRAVSCDENVHGDRLLPGKPTAGCTVAGGPCHKTPTGSRYSGGSPIGARAGYTGWSVRSAGR